MSNRYATSAAFHAALSTRIKTEAKLASKPIQTLTREFLHHRILARLFDPAGEPEAWILKGGSGILVRIPSARPTIDLDLHHNARDPDDTEAALRNALEQPHPSDPIRFTIRRSESLKGVTPGQRIKLEANLGARKLADLSIDVVYSSEHIVPDIEQLIPVVDIDDVAPLPLIRLYPLDRQIADKICAIYETHGVTSTASTRYHDLVDLVLISVNCTLPPTAITATAVAIEATRRSLLLPRTLISPSPSWSTGYAASATQSTLPPRLHALDAALEYAGAYLNPVLQSIQPH